MDFKPPQVSVGDKVLWYQNADKAANHCYAATVVAVKGVTVDLKVQRNAVEDDFRDTVRHIDDPCFEHNANFREFGGWEFADEHKRVEALEEKVARLEALLDDFLTTPDDKPAKSKKGGN